MKLFNNVNEFVKDDLKAQITPGSKISIAAGCFSIYAYQELKEQLKDISELRFIFTYPTFTTEKSQKAKREFYIPRISREKSLYGTEFEVKLRNELNQKAIASECAEWIRQKVKFRSNKTDEVMQGFMHLENKSPVCYFPLGGFTTIDIGCERGNNAYNLVNRFSSPMSQSYLQIFNSIWNDKQKLQDVTDAVIENISTVYRENPPEFIYFITLYNIFKEFLEDISVDELPNEALGFKQSLIWNKLYDFQKDAVLAIISKLEKYNGCILADSVGLGKTFTALAVVKYYENRNKNVLVLCPKKLTNNWNTYKDNYINNPIAKDRLRYDVLYHTDLSRSDGNSNGLDLSRLNWGAYDLVVIDESHNFRNGGQLYGDDGDKRENRYLQLLNKVIKNGVKTKVLMLSATPVNNRFTDLRNQIALAYEGDASNINDKLNTKHSIEEIFRRAQGEFNKWSKLPPEERIADTLLKSLDYDFFELLDSVTIARSRKHIEKYYNTAEIGKFPERLKPISLEPCITKLKSAINYKEIYEQLQSITLSVYLPSNYVFESARAKYEEQYGSDMGNTFFKQSDREKGIHRLSSIGLLKRLESSVWAFRLTLERIKELNEKTIRIIDRFEKTHNADLFETVELQAEAELDSEDGNTDLFSVGRKVKYSLSDMDYESWRNDLKADVYNLEILLSMIKDITPEHDNKLNTLFAQIDKKLTNPINKGNRKIIIFTAFSDTADYLYEHVSKYALEKYGIHTAIITGTVEGRSTVPKMKLDMNTVLTCFSPISKEKHLLLPNDNTNIDILIATDCISEGQNLQDCDFLVNYDIHWNPVRIIQRFGRIDRIGSKNGKIQLVNFWPDIALDDYINLRSRVETRMKITIMTATGVSTDNIINDDENARDLDYRKKQLDRLREEVIDIEDMNTGISIMDLGLNEFRLDLLEYVKKHGECDNVPFGMHAVVPATKDSPAGVIYILKNRNQGINIDKQNRLHPFYMVYIKTDGDVQCNHLEPKKLLDTLRLLCKGKSEIYSKLCKTFNKETVDGRKMGKYSKLLGQTIKSIISVKEESDFDSLFTTGGTSVLENDIKGLDDFELISFIIVKDEK